MYNIINNHHQQHATNNHAQLQLKSQYPLFKGHIWVKVIEPLQNLHSAKFMFLITFIPDPTAYHNIS